MKALVCGDVHLTNYGMFNEPTDDPAVGSRLSYILKALDDFFAYGKENNINTYIINGDLFDSRQSDNPTTLAHIRKHFITSFRNLTNVNKATLYLNSGNHDQYTRSVIPNSLEDFELYSTDTHRIKVINAVTPIQVDNNTELFFIPYDEDIKGTKEAVNDYLYKHPFNGAVNVFAHLGVTGATQGRWNHRLGGAFNLDDLGWNAPNVKSISLSHYHNRNTLYPCIEGNIELPSDTPNLHNGISENKVNIIKYNFENLGLKINYDKGLVINRPTYVGTGGYIYTTLKDENNKYYTVPVAMIIAFKKYGGKELIGKQVDHINNKHGINDNYPDNLQLLTARQNLEKEMIDNNRKIKCKAKNYFTGTEVHAGSIYELSKRIKVAVSSIQKCVKGDSNVAGDFLVTKEENEYNYNVQFNHFSVQGKNLATGELTPVFNKVSKAEEWLNIPMGGGHIGEVCRGIHKQTKGYTWWYVPSHPESWYIGDLTALNFNDIGSDGLGVSRGFDEIDLDTGEHKFIDLTQSPYNIPTFNQINLDTDDNFDLATQVDDHSYYKISCKSKDTYEKLAKELENNSIASRVQLILLPQEQRVTIDVDANATDTELVSKYCDLNYPEVKDKALDYLRKAKEAE